MGDGFLYTLIPASFFHRLLSELLCLHVEITLRWPVSPQFSPSLLSSLRVVLQVADPFCGIAADNLAVARHPWLSLGSGCVDVTGDFLLSFR